MLDSEGITTPIRLDVADASVPATWLRTYPVSRTAAITRSRVRSDTGPTFRRMRETVISLTSASLATSARVIEAAAPVTRRLFGLS